MYPSYKWSARSFLSEFETSLSISLTLKTDVLHTHVHTRDKYCDGYTEYTRAYTDKYCEGYTEYESNVIL